MSITKGVRMRLSGVGKALVLSPLLIGCGRSQEAESLVRASKELPRLIAEARAQGVALSPADLTSGPLIPDSQNAAKKYVLASKKLSEAPTSVNVLYGTPKHFGLGRPGTEAELAQAREFLKKARAAFVVLDEATAMEKFDLRLTFAPGALDFPELARIRELSKASSIRAVVAAHDHDATELEKALRSMGSATRRLESSPGLIAHLVGLALGSIEFRTIEDCLVEAEGDRTVIKVCRAALSAMPSTFDPQRAFRGECVHSLALIDSLTGKDAVTDLGDLAKALEVDVESRKARNEKVDPKVVRDALKAKSLGMYIEILGALNHSKGLKAQAMALQALSEKNAKATDFASKVMNTLAGEFDGYFVAIRKYELRREAFLVGLKILENYGTNPPAMVPANVIGPNMAYFRTDSGFRVEPVGFDIPAEKAPDVKLMRFQYPRLREAK